jgi:hypothetical protein
VASNEVTRGWGGGRKQGNIDTHTHNSAKCSITERWFSVNAAVISLEIWELTLVSASLSVFAFVKYCCYLLRFFNKLDALILFSLSNLVKSECFHSKGLFLMNGYSFSTHKAQYLVSCTCKKVLFVQSGLNMFWSDLPLFLYRSCSSFRNIGHSPHTSIWPYSVRLFWLCSKLDLIWLHLKLSIARCWLGGLFFWNPVGSTQGRQD